MELAYKNKKSIKEIEQKIQRVCEQNNKIILPKDNMFISGDNFNAMCRLLPKFENTIDLVYIDPPFNTQGTFHYNQSNPSTISHSKDDMIAYDDNMDLEMYFEFMRERIYLIKKLLSDKGTLYVHIDIKVGHYIKIILDEVFGRDCFMNEITRTKSNPKNFNRKAYGNEKDVIYVYSKVKNNNIFNNIKIELTAEEISTKFSKVDKNGRRYTTVPCHAPGETLNGDTGLMWRNMPPPKGRHWRTIPQELENMDKNGLIEWSRTNNPRIIKYADEHSGKKMQDIWQNYKDPQKPMYPTEKNNSMLNTIIRQSSNESSIIMDCFAGSCSFLNEGLKLNRRVIGIDKSLISINLLKEREIDTKLDILMND